MSYFQNIDASIFSILADLMVEGLPADQQGSCIDAFFSENDFFSDEEHDYINSNWEKAMNEILMTYGYCIPPEVRTMMEDWRDNGF